MRPDTWDQLREGARKIKLRHGVPAGFGLAPESDSNAALRGLLWAHGAAEQDEAGQLRINSRETVEAVKLMTAIFRDAMTADVFTWDPSSNNRLYVSGRTSIIQNAVSALRTAERQNPEVARKTALVPAAAGPRGRLGCVQLVHCYVVWKFAEQRELAKRFLVDLVAAGPEAFRASEFYQLPAFSRVVPDLRGRLGAEKPYQLLADAGQWSAVPGHPGSGQRGDRRGRASLRRPADVRPCRPGRAGAGGIGAPGRGRDEAALQPVGRADSMKRLSSDRTFFHFDPTPSAGDPGGPG